MSKNEKLNLALAALIGLLLGVSGVLMVEKSVGPGKPFGGEAGNQLIDKATITSLEQACGPLQIDVRNNAAAFIAGLAALGIK